jgi:peptide/nickel transport system permease protein
MASVALPPEVAAPRLARFGRHDLLGICAFLLVACFLVASLTAPWWVSQPPSSEDLLARLQPPVWSAHGTSHHLLGTDELGRDVLARVAYGARISFEIGFASATLAALLGTLAGVGAGYLGGFFGGVVRRLIDIQTAFPFLIIALTIVAVFGASVKTLIITLAFWTWVPFARVAQGRALVIREMPFVLAARSIGAGRSWIIAKHVLPNVVAPLAVLWSFVVAQAIVAESALSFLGVGLPPPTPSWGSMLSEGRTYLSTAWWIAVVPGLALGVLIAAINMGGSWLSARLDSRTSEAVSRG